MFIARLAAMTLVPVAVALAVVLPLHFPISNSAYQDLPTLAPLVAAAFSGVGSGLVSYSHFSRTKKQSRAIEVSIWIGLGGAAVAWYLAMFIILNLKGS
jgi:hypothetical protein